MRTFDWDDGNRTKCQSHGMSLTEIEAVLSGGPRIAPAMKHSSRDQRFVAVGRMPAGRAAFVVFTWRATRMRPLSARFMHGKEARSYEASGS